MWIKPGTCSKWRTRASSEIVYIIEFKCGHGAAAALDQIRRKDYARKYRITGKKIVLVGIDFDADKRNIAEWRCETIDGNHGESERGE